MRLDKLLSKKGMGSRNDVKKYIRKGTVTINGNVIKSSDHKIDPLDIVKIDNVEIKTNLNHYYILHKPKGYVCAMKDNLHKCVVELFPNIKDLKHVGRLDIDTTGLLLLTDDGAWAHQIINGKNNVIKKYLVTLEFPISDNQIKLLQQPMELSDFTTKPCKVTKVNNKQIIMELTEGKFHQVKRMIHHVENEVIELHRLAVGGYVLDDLKEGQYKEIDPGLLL